MCFFCSCSPLRSFSNLSLVLAIDSNHTHCAQHSSVTSLTYNLEFQLFSFSQSNARLVPLELLRGGDPLAGGLVGQPLVVELPHLMANTFQLKHRVCKQFDGEHPLQKQKELPSGRGQFCRYWQLKSR